MYQGYHGYHTDGPARTGRYHKMFIMVDKGSAEASGEGGSTAAERVDNASNIRVVPSDRIVDIACKSAALEAPAPHGVSPTPTAHGASPEPSPPFARAAVDTLGGVSTSSVSEGGEADDVVEHHVEALDYALHEQVGTLLEGAWGDMRSDANAGGNPFHVKVDELACTIPMRPGDVLFFRDDIWHRTADMSIDRTALIIDILRLPLPDELGLEQEIELMSGVVN